MVIGIFFSEVGTGLIGLLAQNDLNIYAIPCIKNEILMYLRKRNKITAEVSLETKSV